MTTRTTRFFLLAFLLFFDFAALGLAPLSTARGFEPNRGQLADAGTQFFRRFRHYSVALKGQGVSLFWNDSGKPRNASLSLISANDSAPAIGEQELPAKVNYLIGNDPAGWRTNIPTFSRVRVPNAYPGVDLVYYQNADSALEYDFIVAPGADPSTIRMSFSGADRTVFSRGEITLHIGADEFRLRRPVAYQQIDGIRHEVMVDYVVHHGNIRFRLGHYDRSRPLIIDPVLVFSRYLGGSNSTYADNVTSLATDPAGNVFAVSYTQSTDFPKLNALYSSGTFAVTKFNSAGVMLFSTFIGSVSGISGARAATDSSGNVYLLGVGTVPTTAGAYKTAPGGSDFFVTKLSADGTQLLYSTYVGGSLSELGYYGGILGAPGLAVDSSGRAYVVGASQSNDFPVVNGNARPAGDIAAGGLYAFRLNATGTALDWSTYIANAGFPAGAALDGSNNLVFAGTEIPFNANFTPMTATSGAFQTTRAAGDDVFVGKLDSSGNLVYLTFLGGNGANDATDVAADSAGNAYVTGQTTSTTFPTASAYQSSCKGYIICVDAFVTKLNPNGNGLVFSTYLGGSLSATGSGSADRGLGIRPDANGNVWVTGYTSANDFPTSGAIQAACSQASAGTCSEDVFVTEFSSTGSLLFSTYLGGTANDEANAIAVSSAGDVYVGGTTLSTNFPKKGPTSSYAGSGDGFVFKLSSVSRAEIVASPTSYTFPNTVVGLLAAVQVTLGASADQTVTVSSIVPNQAEYHVVSDLCSNVALATGATCTFYIQFAPTSVGTKPVTVFINSNANATPLQISMTGTAYVRPLASLTPSSLIFSSQAFQTTSTAQQATLSNTGNGVMQVGTITTTGDFAHPATTCGVSLDPSASCTINVTFTPTAAGSRTGTLSVVTDAAGSPQTISLSGTGLMATASVSPTSLSYTQTLNVTSTSKSVTLSNTGGATMHIASIAIPAGPFALVTGTCGATLAPAANCTINVVFTPTVTTTANATLTITHDGTNSPTTVSLSGSGLFPAANISSFSPAKATAGWPAFSLTINGSNFVNGGGLFINNHQALYTFISSNQIIATVGANDVANIGSIQVTFSNPTPGGGGNIVLYSISANIAPEGAVETAVASADGTATIAQYGGLSTSGWAGDPNDGAPVARVNVVLSPAPPVPSAGVLFIDNAFRIRRIDPGTVLTTYAGTGTQGFSGDAGAATSANINPSSGGIAADAAGNIYFSDTLNYRVRKVNASTGIITTIAGNGTNAYGANSVQATATSASSPGPIALDSSGNVYFGEGGSRIRKITVSTGVITTIAGATTTGFSGDNGAATSATFNGIVAIALDSNNNVYISDANNHRLRMITASTGVVTTIAGNGTTTPAADGTAATAAGFSYIAGVAVDSSGVVYISDYQISSVRKFTVGGTLSNVAGGGSTEVSPGPLALDGGGTLYVSDGYNKLIHRIVLATSSRTVLGANPLNPPVSYSGLAGDALLYPQAVVAVGGPFSSTTAYATLGGSRPDIATSKSNPAYASSGWTNTLNVGSLPPGNYVARAVAVDLSSAPTLLGPAKNITITSGSGPYAKVQSVPGIFSSLVHSPGDPQSIVLGNIGTAPLIVSSISTSAGFTQSNNCTTIAPGATCNIAVRFYPSAVGVFSGTVTINHNASDAITVVSVSGSSYDRTVQLLRPGRIRRTEVNPVPVVSGARLVSDIPRVLIMYVVAIPQPNLTPSLDDNKNGREKKTEKKHLKSGGGTRGKGQGARKSKTAAD